MLGSIVGRCNKRALEAMIRSGAFDEIGPDGEIGYKRSVMMACMDEAVKLAEATCAQ